MPIAEAMAQDDTEFDRLLEEAREWDRRDRARHQSFGMSDGAPSVPQAAPPAPPAPPATPKRAEATWGASRARKRNAFGWIWIVILLYFVVKHFIR